MGLSSGRCVDVPTHSTAVPTRVDIWDCNSGGNQRWTINADGTIRGVESGLCLDARANGTTDGTVVQTYTCNGGANQQWNIS